MSEAVTVPVLRFPEFEGAWLPTTLGQESTCLDSKRVPLEQADRAKRSGPYPYYGASGIIDYIDDFIFDEELVLLGEDGANIINRNSPLAFLANGKFWVNNHAHVYRAKGSNRFLATYLENLRYEKYNTGTAQPKLNGEVCKKLKLNFPSLPEQKKIAAFLGVVDAKLTALRERVALLEHYKRGLMQALFSQSLRFTKPDGTAFPDWEEKRLGDYLQLSKIRVPSQTELPVYSSSRTGLKPQKDYFSDRELSNEGEYGVVPDGFITYRHMSDDLTFKFNLNNLGYDIVVSKEYPVFSTVNMDIRYLLAWLNNSPDFARFAVMQKMGGTRTRLYFKTLEKWKVFLPNPDEQQKIADALSAMDAKIAAVADQVARMEQFKKGLLQQMFV
jgi:type I restriction enzyme S subunit